MLPQAPVRLFLALSLYNAFLLDNLTHVSLGLDESKLRAELAEAYTIDVSVL